MKYPTTTTASIHSNISARWSIRGPLDYTLSSKIGLCCCCCLGTQRFVGGNRISGDLIDCTDLIQPRVTFREFCGGGTEVDQRANGTAFRGWCMADAVAAI